MSVKKFSKRGIGVIIVIVITIVGLIAVKTRSLKNELGQKEAELAAVEERIVAAGEETQAINDEILYRQTDEYIEDRAREDLGLRYGDEIILRPEGEE